MARRHMLARVQHFTWRRADWNRALFSDKSDTNERYADCCLLKRDQFGGGSLMVWGGIMDGQTTGFLVMQGNF